MQIVVGLVISLFFQFSYAKESLKLVDLAQVELSDQLRTDLGPLIKSARKMKPMVVGALYDCKSYCKFIDFLGSPVLALELPDSINIKDLRFVHKDSKPFLALFGKDDIAKANREMIEKQKSFRRQIPVIDTDEIDDPKDPATYFFSYSFEPNYRQQSLKTELSLQERLQTKPFASYRLASDFAPNIRVKIKGQKFYSSVFAAIESSSKRESTLAEDFIVQSLEYEYGIRLHNLQWGGLIGIGAFALKHSDKTSSDSIQGYSTDYEAKGITFNGDFENIKFEINYALAVTVFDSQAYRAQPFVGQWARLRVGYCREKIAIWSLEFDSCIGYMGTRNHQSARLSPNIDFTGTPVNYEDIYHGIFITIAGGDRLREKMK